jgi:hypothetical protein
VERLRSVSTRGVSVNLIRNILFVVPLICRVSEGLSAVGDVREARQVRL